MIPYGKQNVSEEDIKAVVDVLRSDFITQGPCVPQFEANICQATNATHAVAVNSATSALHIACKALGLGPGDWLWTVPNTFVASANCGLYCGAQIDFVDIEMETYNICPTALRHKLEKAKESGRLPKILIPVHFAGQPCDLEAIAVLSKEFNFSVIEDASHAIGSSYKNSKIGECFYSDITVFSFHPVKIITTGEGGVATTNNKDLATKMQLFRSHGITRDPELITNCDQGPWYYEQITLGWNYRMTDIQAALGNSQLCRLDHCIYQRQLIRQEYDAKLAGLRIVIPKQKPERISALHLYPVVLLEPHRKLEIFNRLRVLGIGVNVHYIPVHLQPYYRKMGFTEGDFPFSEEYSQASISLPIFPTMKRSDQDEVINSMREVVGEK